MSGTKVYDCDNVSVVVCDIPITEGLGEDEFLKITPVGPAFGSTIGANGEVCRHATHERRYKVELTLLASSIHNAQLSALHAVDSGTPGGSGVGAFLAKDNNGASLHAGGQGWIEEAPEVVYMKAIGQRVWKFEVVADPQTMISGGN